MNKLFLLLLLFTTHAYAQDLPPEVKEEQILPYLEQVIDYSHSLADAEQVPDNAREAIIKDNLKASARKILQKSFEFGSAQAIIFDQVKPQEAEQAVIDETTRRGRLLKAIENNNKNIEELQTKLTVPGLRGPARERLNGEMKLAIAQHDLLKTMKDIFSSEDTGSSSLSDQIKGLSRSELMTAPPATTDAAKTVPAKENEQAQDSDGMLKLSTTMFSYSRKQMKIKNLIDQNKALSDKTMSIVASIRASLRAAIESGKALAASEGDDAKSMAEYRKSLAQLMNRYKMLSATIIPLGEINMLLESSQNNLRQWNKLISEDWNTTMRQLITRLIILAIAVSIPLAFSSAAHRAIKRYVKDPRRQKLLNIVRRAILTLVLAFVIMANFISEFGSLATFAGFITAGLAVALQTVLVSLVAHFFFFGRYGIKAGDRVTISDVTGDVMQVGALRLYISELKEVDGKLVPSGKMVAFPNSIMFQPAAFYKHID